MSFIWPMTGCFIRTLKRYIPLTSCVHVSSVDVYMPNDRQQSVIENNKIAKDNLLQDDIRQVFDVLDQVRSLGLGR